VRGRIDLSRDAEMSASVPEPQLTLSPYPVEPPHEMIVDYQQKQKKKRKRKWRKMGGWAEEKTGGEERSEVWWLNGL